MIGRNFIAKDAKKFFRT